METSFINLSNAQVAKFVESNEQLSTLASEAGFLDGNLSPDNQANEEGRTGLGLFHTALKLNHELSESNEVNVLENILKLMHNSGMRISEFFEQYIKSEPKKELPYYEEEAELVIKKDDFFDSLFYTLKQKDGQAITVKVNKDPTPDSDSYDGYEIKYAHIKEGSTQVAKVADRETRQKDEELIFEALPNLNHYALRSQRAHLYDLDKPIKPNERTAIANVDSEFSAMQATQEEIPLGRLDLHSDTSYIKNLYQALKEKL